MFLHIIKKDLLRKKTMNIILLMFIILASMFLSSSVNNLLVASNSLDKFFEKADVPDYFIFARENKDEDEKIISWISKDENITDYEEKSMHTVNYSDFSFPNIEEINSENSLVIGTQSEKYNRVFDENNKLIKLEEGEIALPIDFKKSQGFNLGDKITLNINDYRIDFVITYFAKDAMLGPQFISIDNFLISSEDYSKINSRMDVNTKVKFYNIESKDVNEINKSFTKLESTSTIFNGDKELLKMMYIMNIIMSISLIIISVCLLLISFLILRFTIIFTLQEDFREIGVMKAIGIKSDGIRKIYIAKYLVIALGGAFIGLTFSFPFGKLLLRGINESIILETSPWVFLINLACSIIVVGIVVLFCYLCTRKLNRFSPIEAIRNGSNGESFKRKGFMRLEKSKRITPVLFMAINDVMSNLKRFGVLIMTFTIGILMLILPMNAMNTLKDDNIISLFSIAKTDFYIENSKAMNEYVLKGDKSYIVDDLKRIEKIISEKGVDADLSIDSQFNVTAKNKANDTSAIIYARQGVNIDTSRFDYLEGTPPRLKNEIAITEISADDLGVTIGDKIEITVGKDTKEYIITALYQSMNNLGKALRFSKDAEIDYRAITSVICIQADFKEQGLKNNVKEKLIESLKENISSDYKILNAKDRTISYIKGIIDQLDGLKNLILLIVIGVNVLVTVLMVKSFVAKETGELAMLKSIGFRNMYLKSWQVIRIAIVLFISILLGIATSFALSDVTMGSIFKMMGASQIKLAVNPLEVYILYPAIILVATTLSALLSVFNISKISIREINNME
ncbi:FtsX-like permease family protein [Clostridium intestinale]|uniref:ABC transporter permease n=1 Tax=Clostridium intestinale TaxID=36845 RepID=UPI0028EAAC0E|nr:FtsX-like permease family protein [Clostridium intestinale]